MERIIRKVESIGSTKKSLPMILRHVKFNDRDGRIFYKTLIFCQCQLNHTFVSCQGTTLGF